MKARLLTLPFYLSMSCSAHVEEETRILKTSAFALLLNYLRFSESPINVNTKPHRCIAGSPTASTRPQKFTTSAYINIICLINKVYFQFDKKCQF